MEIDQYIRDHILLDFVIYCNRTPERLTPGSETFAITNSDRWGKAIYSGSIDTFEKNIRKFKRENISFTSRIEKKQSLLAALLTVSRGEQYIPNIVFNIIKWAIYLAFTLFIPIVAGTFSMEELTNMLDAKLYNNPTQ